MALTEIEKEFCLTDNSVNVYGYRLLTEGLQLDRFKPSIGFLMHEREKGVAVKWTDFRTEGDRLYAKPNVNTSLFPDLAQQILDGFYDCASVGHIVPLKMSDDPKLKLEGQTLPTVTEWFPRECSIVDISGNYNALGQLYDERGSILHDLVANPVFTVPTTPKNEMEIVLNASTIQLLNLKADATPEMFTQALANLVAKAQKTDELEAELQNLKAGQSEAEVKAIIAQGLADRKMTKEMATALAADYKEKPEALKALVATMKPQQLVTDRITGGKTPDGLPEKYRGKSFNDLYVSGYLADLKANFPDYFETLKNKK